MLMTRMGDRCFDYWSAVPGLQQPPDSPHPHTLQEGLTTAGEGKVFGLICKWSKLSI